MMAWSEVALQERTMCSNLPSTGTAVFTTGGYLPNLLETITKKVNFKTHLAHMMTAEQTVMYLQFNVT